MSMYLKSNKAIPTLHASFNEEEARYVCNVLGNYCFKTESWPVMHTIRDKRLDKAMRRGRLWIAKNHK